MRAAYVVATALVVLVLAQSVVADRLFAVSPSGKRYLLATCAPGETCSRDNIDVEFCNEEGQWTLLFEGAYGSSVSNAHFVDWDVKKYCRASCMPVIDGVRSRPAWSDDAQLCCGDDPAVSGSKVDCGLRASNSLCVQTSKSSTETAWAWLHKDADAGRMAPSVCGNVEVVAAGGRFYSCGQSSLARFGSTFAPVTKKVLSLDGVNDQVDLGDTGPSGDAFSVEFMLKSKPANRTQKVITKAGTVASFRVLLLPDGRPQFTIGTDEGEFAVTGSKPVNDELWHHLAFVYTGSQLQVFVEGIIDSIAPARGDISVSSTKTLVGSEVAQPLYFSGLIDDLRLHRGALSVDYARQSYLAWWSNSQAPASSALIASYSFDLDASDGSGGRHGVLQNGASIQPANISISSVREGTSTSPFAVVNASRDGVSHGYACFVDRDEKSHIAECTGTRAPFSSSGIIKGPGGAVSGVSQYARDVQWYCKADGAWWIDLDDDSVACSGAGFAWTGRRCCSEGDDLIEFYNDPYVGEGTGGGCWNKTLVGFGKLATPEKSVVNHNGTFRGCSLPSTSPLLLINDTHSCGPIVASNDLPCTVLTDAQGKNKHLFCSTTGAWLNDAKGNRSHLSAIAWNVTGAVNRSECCPPGDCWDGSQCVQNQLVSAEDRTTNGFRCINGSWGTQPVKHNWNRFKRGFCPSPTQCLVDPLGSFANNNQPRLFYNGSSVGPQCIDDGQYVMDYYCDRGNWTTRSKLAGLRLLDLAKRVSPGDYALFCDSPLNAFAFVNFTAASRPAVEYIERCPIGSGEYPCMNNVCVLRYGSQVAFGTSVNVPVNSSRGVLLALNKSASLCDSVPVGSREPVSCGQGVYYDPSRELVFVVPQGQLSASVSDALVSQPFNALLSFVFRSLHSPTQDYSYFNNTRLFARLYSAAGGEGFRAFAFLEDGIFDESIGRARDYMGVTYDGVAGIDVCRFVQTYPPNQDSISPASCNSTAVGQVQVVAQRTQPGGLLDAWRDVTAKLRSS